jgi:hypothetical protein
MMTSEIRNIEKFVVLSPVQRLLRFKWWFYVLVVLGLIAAGYSIIREFQAAGDPLHKKEQQTPPSSALLLVSPLQSGDSVKDGDGTKGKIDDAVKPYVMAGIFSVIGLVTLTSLLVSLTAKDKDRITAASDTLKTCLGFFIGVATGYF